MCIVWEESNYFFLEKRRMPPKVKKVPKKKNDKIITSRGSIPKFSKKIDMLDL